MTKIYTQLRSRRIAGLALSLVIFFSITGFSGMAQPLLVENFDYTIGSLLTDNGWTAHSGQGTESPDVTNGLVFSGYAGSAIGGAANLDNNGEDVHTTFAEQTTGTVYAAFIVKILAPNAEGYFMHFGQSTLGTTFFTRLYVNQTGNGIGLGLGNTPPENYAPVAPGEEALVVFKLDIGTKVSSIYVFNTFPTSEPSVPFASVTETATFTAVGSIALRQFNAAQSVIVDGIRVANNWNDAVAASSVTIPAISASPAVLTNFNYGIGNGPSASQEYVVSGIDLEPATGNITITPPTHYEISIDNSTFGQTPISLPYTDNTLSPSNIYVRLVAGLDAGDYNDEVITNSGGDATAVNVTCHGTVEAPASTALPYAQDFATGFGDIYTFSVSGPDKFWKHSSSNEYAYMNGYNTGLLEEDWMILPAVNFDTYTDVRLSFDSYINYGDDNADNYFKLLYSADYAGIGDPSLATWTEISFDYPTELETWTPSGILNLSGIAGTDVYIGFQYHYNPDFYRSWQIDNISMYNDPVGISNQDAETGKIYAYGKTLKIELNQKADATVQVINLYGQQVASYKLNNTTATYTLDVPVGAYLVRILNKNGSFSKKVMVK